MPIVKKNVKLTPEEYLEGEFHSDIHHEDEPKAELYRRREKRWELLIDTGPKGRLELQLMGMRFSLSEIYRGVAFS